MSGRCPLVVPSWAERRGYCCSRVPGGLTIVPTTIETLVHGWRDPIEYDWPVVVMERLLPVSD
jgi:hypothetical protein